MKDSLSAGDIGLDPAQVELLDSVNSRGSGQRLGLVGFGNVGQGLAQILCDSGEEYALTLGLNIKIVAVADALKGNVYNPLGLDARRPAGKSGVWRQLARFSWRKAWLGCVRG